MNKLEIIGTGSYLPPLQSARDLAARAGADVSAYMNWPNIPVGGPDDHPSTMGLAALRAALDHAGLEPGALSLVIFGGMSRDYPPSWSPAAEIMKLSGCGNTCLGIDVTDGCMGGMVSFDLALGWLSMRGGGHGAIVCAERWTHTVDRSQPDSMPMWGIGDGAAATIVALNSGQTALAAYCGTEYCSKSELNGNVLVRYGGTRFPTAPPGVNPTARSVGGKPRGDVRTLYVEGYGTALKRMRERFGATPDRLICNQISEPLLMDIAALAGVPFDRVVQTGKHIGHIGSADLQLGLESLLRDGGIDCPVTVSASTPYLFGAGYMVPA